jgi:hypothetical protein
MSATSPSPDSAPVSPIIGEVRYSLPQMLKELEIERAAGSFATEKLDQLEIGKLFKTRTQSRRAKPKK